MAHKPGYRYILLKKNFFLNKIITVISLMIFGSMEVVLCIHGIKMIKVAQLLTQEQSWMTRLYFMICCIALFSCSIKQTIFKGLYKSTACKAGSTNLTVSHPINHWYNLTPEALRGLHLDVSHKPFNRRIVFVRIYCGLLYIRVA